MHIIVVDLSGKTTPVRENIAQNPKEYETFTANRNSAGDLVITVEGENIDLYQVVTEKLEQLPQYQIKNQYIRVYTPRLTMIKGISLMVHPKEDPDTKNEVPLEYMNLKDLNKPEFWSKQDKFYKTYNSSSALIQNKLLQLTSYRRLKKYWRNNTDGMEAWRSIEERYNLHDQRFSELSYEICKIDGCMSDQDLMASLMTYHRNWGKNIARKDHSMMAQLYVDRENQYGINIDKEGYLYFRSDLEPNKSRLFEDYIETFKLEYKSRYGQELIIQKCVPIDIDLIDFPELALNSNVKRVSIHEEGGRSEFTARDHFILVFETEVEASEMLVTIQTLGLLPTMQKMYHRINKLSDDYYSLQPVVDRHGDSLYRKEQLPEFNSLEDLINSAVYQKYKQLGLINNPELPYLTVHVNAITSMLEALKDYIKNNPVPLHRLEILKHGYTFIFEYMTFATLYYKDHRRWVNTFEWLMEEMIFILAIVEPYGMDDFASIMRDNMKTCHSPELLQKDMDYQFGLYNSGMRAIFEALLAAKNSTGLSNPAVVFLDNIYYEAAKVLEFFKAEKCAYRMQGINNPDADVYVMNIGASLSLSEENIYSVDVNRFIGELFSKRKNNRPVTLILDSTLVDIGGQKVTDILVKNQNRIKDGLLNLVFAHSLQKYGMLGADKVQAGMVWAINNPHVFSKYNEMISSSSHQSHYFDRQLVSHIAKHAYQPLRQAMLISFKGGQILRDFFRSQPDRYAIDELKDSPFYFRRFPAPSSAAPDEPSPKSSAYNFFLNRASFGFPHTVGTRISNTTEPKFYYDRFAAGMEGESKLNLLAAMVDYPHKDKAALLDLIESLPISDLEYSAQDSFADLLEKVVHVLSKPQFRNLLCEQYIKVVVCLKGIVDSSASDKLPHKTHLFNLLNLVLRVHNVPLPPEIYQKLHEEMDAIKTQVLNEIQFKLNYFKALPMSNFIQLSANQFTINTLRLEGLKDVLTSYINDQNLAVIQPALDAIDDYLLTQSHSKLLKLPKTMELVFKICDSLKAICVDESISPDLTTKLTSVKPKDVDKNPSVIIHGHDSNRKVHVFFDNLDDAKNFVALSGLNISPEDLIDTDRKSSKDPVVAKMYSHPVISLSIEQYVLLLLEAKQILPKHDSKFILSHCKEARQCYEQALKYAERNTTPRL